MNTKSNASRYILLFTITYFVSYITRINYGAIISEMELSTGFSRSLLSMALTGSFITYGTGQIISGICGDRIAPRKLISYGLTVTILMNLLIPLCRTPYHMLAVWCVNGFAQAFMWPPLVKLMTILLTEDEYKKATARVSMGSSLGTIAVYLLSPALISIAGWRSVFIFSAACGILMLLLWNKVCRETDTAVQTSIKESHSEKSVAACGTDTNTLLPQHSSGFRMLLQPALICIMLIIILQGMLRDGVTTWMPSFISETYRLSNLIGILTGVILPIFSILCFQVSSRLYREKFQNPVLCAALFFAVGCLSALTLTLVNGKTAAMSVLCSALLTGAMHGVNLMLICMIPPFFKNTGKVSTVSGVLNACTYIGSAISTYGVALLSERYGWGFTLLSWLAIACAGTVLSLIAAHLWNRRKTDY